MPVLAYFFSSSHSRLIPFCTFGPYCLSVTFYVYYIVIFLPLPDAPRVTIQQCSTPVNESDNVTLYCNATGNPAPNIMWIKPGEVVLYKKMLVISNISRDKRGSYKCLAWNDIANDTDNCTVDVQCKLHYY